MKPIERIETFEGWLIRYHPNESVTQELYNDYLRWQMGYHPETKGSDADAKAKKD